MLLDQIKRAIDRHHLVEKGDRLIVGVSGGVDSMVLLHLLNACREAFDLSLIVAHVNHGLRPAESEKEAELVRKEAARLGCPFEYGQFHAKEFQKRGGLSPQDAARRIRFDFFYSLLQKHHAQKIALGHHADDQVETVLLRLIRGAGLQGLKGMLPIREGIVIRPLLEVWGGNIQSFAVEKNIPFLTDSSNLKKDYLRNKIRLALVPLMEREYQPNFKEILLRTSNILREENDYLEKGAEAAYQQVVREEGETLSFKFSEYQSLHQAIRWRVIRKVLEKICDWGAAVGEGEWSNVHKVYQKLHQSSPSFVLELSPGAWVEKRYDAVLLGRGKVEPSLPFDVELISPGRTSIPEIGKEVVIEEVNGDKFRDVRGPLNTALMDYGSLQFPLRMRNFRPGDRFYPLGAQGAQKLKEFFIDQKIPSFERRRVPLLVSGGMIVWIAGYRIDERVKVTEKTKKVLAVKIV
jgi:tRNA(Ile)-lysidine synthase